jgi:trimeric autotransporter adhesin
MRRLTNIIHPTFALFTCAMFSLSPPARATCQEGCLTNENTVLGDDALPEPSGTSNTALGFNALHDDTTGQENTAVGWQTQTDNVAGSHNVSLAPYSQGGNASDNTALGIATMLANRGNDNTAVGWEACYLNLTGTSNVAVGIDSLSGTFGSSRNVVLGADAQNDSFDANDNIVVGFEAHGLADDHNILLGSVGFTNDRGTMRIGDSFFSDIAGTYLAGISGTPLTHGTAVAVGITSDGQLGVSVSSARFKEAIKPMDQASETIYALKPVTFRYKKELDRTMTPQFGLIAEEVAKVNPDLIVTDEQGKPFTVRYEAVNAMLLNEFLKEHQRVQTIGSSVERHQKQIATLTTGLQKLSAQVESVKVGRSAVADNP